ncbi:MAG: PH domain-containing protein [Syntrophomonas sp.]
MEFNVKKSYGIIFGLLMGMAIFGFSLWGIDFSLGAGEKTLKIMLYIPAYLFLFIYVILLIGIFNMGYRVENEALIINWGLTRISIPWDDISSVTKVMGRSNLASLFGASWPGYMIGLYSAKGLGAVRMFATYPHEGFIYVKSSRGLYGLTPIDGRMAEIIAEKAGKPLDTIDMDQMPVEIKGKNMQEDNFYKILMGLNIFFLLLFTAYLAIFFPGSGAPKFVVLLLVLAVALFFFSIGNAGRLYQFSQQGGYILLLLGIFVTGIFLILSLAEISL